MKSAERACRVSWCLFAAASLVACGGQTNVELAKRASEVRKRVEELPRRAPPPEPTGPIRGGFGPSKLDEDGSLRWEVVSGRVDAPEGVLFQVLTVTGGEGRYRERQDSAAGVKVLNEKQGKLEAGAVAAIAALVRSRELCGYQSDRAARPQERLMTLAIREAGVDCEITMRELDWPLAPGGGDVIAKVEALKAGLGPAAAKK